MEEEKKWCTALTNFQKYGMSADSSGVPDRRCRVVPEVVLVRRGVFGVLRIWKGESGGRVGSGEVSLQAT